MATWKTSKDAQVESILSNVFDPREHIIFAVRGKGCDVVFSNSLPGARPSAAEDSAINCKNSYAERIPAICDYCPNGKFSGDANGEHFEITDIDGNRYTAKSSTVDWTDGKSATVFILRDITDEKATQERLHALAYTDQLTGVPNRQRLKDDFAELSDGIANNEITGIVALFDLDNFKAVNDTYGHNTGDLVLRRLTDYLEENEIFSKHLYRLGGDEFVLLYTDPGDAYNSEFELVHRYSNLLSNALRSYTLPNIDVYCTISIGVSIFPNHGKNLSEVLRKADIALYKAKAAGRNQIVFFESQYDSAQKFKDLYINIQPILDETEKTYGYELVDRGNDGEHGNDTVRLTEFNRTVDALGLTEIEDKKQYFITYSRQLLNPAVLKNLPKEKFIVQIQLSNRLSSVKLLHDMKICNELRENGYRIALVGLHSGSHAKELLEVADFCKFSDTDIITTKHKKMIADYPKVSFIATNVDTHEEFQAAKDMGYKLFQGFYFNKPMMGTVTKEISPLKVNYLRLVQLCGAEDYMDFREISAIIASDVALSYKLLRILNSAAVGLRDISSVTMAVAYFGEENLKKWIAVLALRGIAEDKPLELVRMSLIRARFGELLAPHFHEPRDVKQVFLVGLLSLLHIALEKTKEQLFEEISIGDVVKDAILNKNGVYSELLRFYENYEYANWDAVSQFVEENQLDPEYVNEAYVTAVRWYNNLVDQ